MKIHCEIVVDNAMQRENLIECLKIIGVEPIVKRDMVCADYEGKADDKQSKLLIEIAENYVRHFIRVIDEKGVRIDEA